LKIQQIKFKFGGAYLGISGSLEKASRNKPDFEENNEINMQVLRSERMS
jgi:hypothetical protein